MARDEDDIETCRLYPMGENTFGRKGGLVKPVFGENRCTVDGTVCKKV
ncbi:MAG: hypothetical protein IKZ82_09180 [Clostridia bacterium]|nr:hypothetical protein [Clostridia bacterium]